MEGGREPHARRVFHLRGGTRLHRLLRRHQPGARTGRAERQRLAVECRGARRDAGVQRQHRAAAHHPGRVCPHPDRQPEHVLPLCNQRDLDLVPAQRASDGVVRPDADGGRARHHADELDGSCKRRPQRVCLGRGLCGGRGQLVPGSGHAFFGRLLGRSQRARVQLDVRGCQSQLRAVGGAGDAERPHRERRQRPELFVVAGHRGRAVQIAALCAGAACHHAEHLPVHALPVRPQHHHGGLRHECAAALHGAHVCDQPHRLRPRQRTVADRRHHLRADLEPVGHCSLGRPGHLAPFVVQPSGRPHRRLASCNPLLLLVQRDQPRRWPARASRLLDGIGHLVQQQPPALRRCDGSLCRVADGWAVVASVCRCVPAVVYGYE
mmetsp:Transcript_30460/g.81095  ORF Transcript_30460/g.81095 Transcript_30460/m.81095 type:complete len:380 (-) Transcript_30460:1544-2683(-)